MHLLLIPQTPAAEFDVATTIIVTLYGTSFLLVTLKVVSKPN